MSAKSLLMWSKKMRHNLKVIFVVCMFINVGMWLERFVIIVTSLHRDFLPSSWEMYYPTVWDFMTLAGTIGLFLTGMFVFVRVLPLIRTRFPRYGVASVIRIHVPYFP